MLRKIMIVVTTSLALSAGLASDALARGDPAAAATAAASATPGTWGGVPSTAAGGGGNNNWSYSGPLSCGNVGEYGTYMPQYGYGYYTDCQ
jgi:hypothetical protein